MKTILFFLFLATCFTSCSVFKKSNDPKSQSKRSNIYYFGNTYAATEKIDVYFNENSIRKSFIIMGKVGLEYNNYYSQQKIYDLYMEKAKEKGADGILVVDNSYIKKGTAINTTTETRIDTIFNKKTSNSSTSIEQDQLIKSEEYYFIKYQ
jgi:hypothetical protein